MSIAAKVLKSLHDVVDMPALGTLGDGSSTNADRPFKRGILTIRAKGILAYALGIMVLFFGFIASIPLFLTNNGSWALIAIVAAYLVFALAVYYRFVGFKKNFRRMMAQTTTPRTDSMDRPDIILSPTFMLAGDKLLDDDYGKFASVAILGIVGLLLAAFYWLLGRLT
jgi:hypothetical protein